MVGPIDLLGKSGYYLGGRQGLRIALLGDDAREAILRERAGRPALPLIGFPPFLRAVEMHMVAETTPAVRSRRTATASSDIFLQPLPDHLGHHLACSGLAVFGKLFRRREHVIIDIERRSHALDVNAPDALM
jgi:hypothetical protein